VASRSQKDKKKEDRKRDQERDAPEKPEMKEGD